MIRRGVGRVAAAVVAAGVVALMAGCAPAAPPAHPTPVAKAGTPDPVSIEDGLPNLLVAGQTIGTGRLQVVDHEPIAAAAAQHPLTGTVRVVVGADRGLEVRIRPDDPATADLTGLDLMISGKRYDGRPENIQDADRFGLVSTSPGAAPDGEVRLLLPLDSPAGGDPTFLHSIEESPSGDGRVLAAAAITWTLPSPYPGLKAVDSGVETYAHGRAVLDGATIAYYVPNPYDTIYAVSRRFGLSEVQLVWLNPELLMGTPQPELTSGIGVNLDPGRR
ncbi:hypothetical protein [Leifsonia sp. EB34]|uniref:hypothetical protein n=1 Tax=Leifsonia sp. EB34 TaxID=3156303 RepID=UPI003513DBD0